MPPVLAVDSHGSALALRARPVLAVAAAAAPSGASETGWVALCEQFAQRRNTFRLMVAVRTFLAAEGIAEARVELRLEDGPGTGGPGDIVVRLGPVEPAPGTASGGGRP